MFFEIKVFLNFEMMAFDNVVKFSKYRCLTKSFFMCNFMFSFFRMTMAGVMTKNTKTVIKVLKMKILSLVPSPLSIKDVRLRSTKQEIIKNERNPVEKKKKINYF